MIVEVLAIVALLLAAITCFRVAARVMEDIPLRALLPKPGTLLPKPGAFRRWSGMLWPRAAVPHAAVGPARFPRVTVAVIIGLLAVFLAEIASTPDRPGDPGFDWTLLAFGAYERHLVLSGEVQVMFISSLLHFDANHLIGNCLVLAVTGWYLERMVGHAWLGCVLGLGVIGGGVASILLMPDCRSAGASDAVAAVEAAAFVVSFRQPRTRQRLVMRCILLVVALPPLLSAINWDEGLNNGAHIGGWVTGLAIGWLLWRAWPADPLRVPLPRLARSLAAALACAFLLSSAAVAGKFPHYQLAVARLIPPSEVPDDWPMPLDRAEALVARYENDPQAHFHMGLVMLDRDDAAGAEREFRQALALIPGFEDLMPHFFTTRLNYELATAVYGEGHRAEARTIARDACIKISVMKPAELAPYLRGRYWSELCIAQSTARR